MHGNIRHGFVYERVPHITLKSIANDAGIDVIWDQWQAKLEPLREKLNAAVGKTWPEWEIPRGADSRWSDAVKKLHADWWQARISEKQRATLLARWEKVSFRIYGMLGKDARTGVGDYVRLAWRVVNERLSADVINAEIGAIGKEFTIEDAVKQLRHDNCYEGWESELRYFMFRYEEHLARKQKQNFRNEQWEKIWMVSPSESIEHIWAKSKAPDRAKHWLGNLVLLPPKLNSTLQDDPAKSKVKAYRKTGLLIAGEVADIIEGEGWKIKQIDDREEALLAWAATEWAD